MQAARHHTVTSDGLLPGAAPGAIYTLKFFPLILRIDSAVTGFRVPVGNKSIEIGFIRDSV